ncbi:MAG: Ig-like domain-containing protein [Gemmatimonadaceae bacterium]|nr:Ig-like domain-containing protein [Gemmatimonadaceae bacterium]
MRASNIDPRIVLAAALTIAVAGGCSDGALATRPSADTSALYWSLTLDHRAVTLALTPPYDTVRLTAVPRNPWGAALDGLGPVTYTSTDLARVRVSADGVVQALADGTGVLVIASLQAGGVTHADTAVVDITSNPNPRPIASLSIHPVSPDSAKVAAQSAAGKQLTVRAFDVGSAPLSALVDFRSSDPAIATVDRNTGIVQGKRPGHVTIVASSTVYGATRADTLPFTIGEPVMYWIQVDRPAVAGAATATTFSPSKVTIGTGGTVMWTWRPDIPATDVTFDDPTNVAADTVGIFGPLHLGVSGPGNIPAVTTCTSDNPFGCFRSRTFPVPGVYTFHSTLTGASGQVTVVDERASP